MLYDRPTFASAELAEQEKISAIENSSLVLDKKLELALLVLGKKQAAQLGNFDIVESNEHRTELTREFGEEYVAVTSLVDKLSLPYDPGEGIKENDGIMGFSILVGRDQNSLDRLVKASREGNDRAFGNLVGYPETAVDTYRTDRAFNFEKDLPAGELGKLRKEGILPFLLFIPSRDHWEEELEFARESKRLIQEKAPRLYGEVMKGAVE